jgi:hypothetical protein
MRVIIAGSRTITHKEVVEEAVRRSGFQITEVVSGCAIGVDSLGEEVARDLAMPVKQFPADWRRLGKKAGFLRNQQMADYADALIAVWDGKSRGTQDMVRRARKAGLQVFVHNPNALYFGEGM